MTTCETCGVDCGSEASLAVHAAMHEHGIIPSDYQPPTRTQAEDRLEAAIRGCRAGLFDAMQIRLAANLIKTAATEDGAAKFKADVVAWLMATCEVHAENYAKHIESGAVERFTADRDGGGE